MDELDGPTPSEKRRAYLLNKRYSLTLEEEKAILEYQDYKCPICSRDIKQSRKRSIDHEHRNKHEGPVRGIPCSYCNRYVIGNLTLDKIRAILNYFENPPARIVLGEDRIAAGNPPRKRKPRKRKPSGKK